MAVLTSPSIDDLILDVRDMLGQPSPTNSFWTDEELAKYLNEGVRRFFVKAVEQFEGSFLTTDTLDITSGVETVTMPTDCFKVKNLWIQDQSDWRILHYRNNLNRGYSTTGSNNSNTYAPSYSFRGRSIVLHDTPNFTQTDVLKLEYVQFPTTMLTGGDSLTDQISPVFKDLIEAYAVYKAKLKESLSNGTDLVSIPKDNLNDLFTAFQEVIGQTSGNPTYTQPWNPEEY